MDPFLELESVTLEQSRSGEFPDDLAEKTLAVARAPERYRGKEYLVEMLASQVRDFSVYGEAGCCKWAFDHEDIRRTLGMLEAEA